MHVVYLAVSYFVWPWLCVCSGSNAVPCARPDKEMAAVEVVEVQDDEDLGWQVGTIMKDVSLQSLEPLSELALPSQNPFGLRVNIVLWHLP